MAQIISISIDLSKIDKTKIIEGKKGKYYNLSVIVNDEKDSFDNDVAVCENQTQAERHDKEPKKYLGSGRVVWTGKSKPKENNSSTPEDTTAPVTTNDNKGDDLPF